jgi:hypothetical protein
LRSSSGSNTRERRFSEKILTGEKASLSYAALKNKQKRQIAYFFSKNPFVNAVFVLQRRVVFLLLSTNSFLAVACNRILAIVVLFVCLFGLCFFDPVLFPQRLSL